jgi:hypothetical protein
VQKRTKYQVRSDAAKQRWVRDDKKESFWRKHIEAWKLSGLSKRAYCIANNLSQSSFNAWNREITIRDREKIPSANAAALLSESEPKSPFVQLRLLHGEPDDVKSEAPKAPVVENNPKQSIEILVPGGAVIRVDETCSVKYVTELFSSLKG